MTDHDLYLVEDPEARSWAPFALTRPVGELLFGTLLQRERVERALAHSVSGYLAPATLAGFAEGEAPRVVVPETLGTDRLRVLISSRVVLPPSGPDTAPLLPSSLPEGGLRLSIGGETLGAILPPGVPLPDAAVSGEGWRGAGWERLPAHRLPGEILAHPWELIDRNAARITDDLAALAVGVEGSSVKPVQSSDGVEIVGTHRVTAEGHVAVDPGVVLDARDGPIHLETGVHLHPFTRLAGPAFVGRGSSLLGGTFNGFSCGPVCKLRGEVEAAVLLGYVNKAHDGYLGHALVGRWVNLGAFTTNSDLKNNYGSVRVPVAPDREVDTGLLKVGVFLGDHVKTGIGTLLNTGSVVGAGSNLFGGAMPPRWVPPFSWGSGSELSTYRLEPFLDTARTAMGRRGVELDEGMAGVLARAWAGEWGTETAG